MNSLVGNPISTNKSIMINDSLIYFPRTPSCIITFTGWILEYSIVYVIDQYNTLSSSSSFNLMEDINSVEDMNYGSFKNCLGNQDLKLVQLFLNSKSNMKIQRYDRFIHLYCH